MIYVHVPFCRSFCTYCDFYSELACGDALFEGYCREVCEEIDSRRDEIARTVDVNTLYIGGGTPSVLPLSILERIVGHCRQAVSGRPWQEFTIEVNPEDLASKGLDYARGLRSLGVTRVSMGVQSLSDTVLRWMNRRHSADGARKAFAILREAGFDNISVDVIFGLGEEAGGFNALCLEETVREILSWRPEHVSAYQLSIEDGSALARMIEDGRYTELAEEECRSQYDFLCRELGRAGYVHYEISNWALPGRKAVHNSAYWTRRPYVGIGPGAHSLAADVRSWNSDEISGWKRSSEVLSAEEIREEAVMLGLRTSDGVDIDGRHLSLKEEEFFIADSIILSELS